MRPLYALLDMTVFAVLYRFMLLFLSVVDVYYSRVVVFPIGPLECQEREVELGKRRKLFSVYDVHEEIGR